MDEGKNPFDFGDEPRRPEPGRLSPDDGSPRRDRPRDPKNLSGWAYNANIAPWW